MESFVYDHKLNGERFDLFCFVCDCTSLAITELSYHLLSNFFLDQKKRTIKLFNFILGLLGNSREILSAAVLDSTDAKCINTFIELIFIYNRRLTLFYKELTGSALIKREALARRIVSRNFGMAF